MKSKQYSLKKLISLSLMSTLLGQASYAYATDWSTMMNSTLVQDEVQPIDYTNLQVEGLLLPRSIYLLKGDALQTERFNIFYKNAVLSNFKNYHLYFQGPYGESLEGRWLFKSDLNNNVYAPESFNLSVSLNLEGTVVNETTTAHVVNKTNTSPIRLLPIGDSLTRAGIYLNEIQNSLPNVSILGTRFYPNDGVPAREGRGGWTVDRYMSAINSSDLDSPFVFPTDVAGINYKGNTRDWQKICYTAPQESIYAGFQKIARGWKDEGDYLYDLNGYYKNPVAGDVMVDPSLPEGQQWVEWTGMSWEPMSIQPTHFEFNFTKYMERFKAAYKEGTPTHISILLGANDFGYNDYIFDLEGHMKRLNEMIDSIHAFDPNIKIILCTPTPAPNTAKVTDSKLEFYYMYDHYMKIATYYLLKTFDNDESLARGIYIAPTHLTLDITNGFDYKDKVEIINGIPTPVTIAANSIHPNNSFGQLQMGDTLAAVLQYTR